MSALPFGLTSIVQVSYMHQPLLTCRGKPTRGGEAGRDWAFMVQLKHCCAEDAAANCSTWEVPPPRRPAAPGEGAHVCWRRPRASLGADPASPPRHPKPPPLRSAAQACAPLPPADMCASCDAVPQARYRPGAGAPDGATGPNLLRCALRAAGRAGPTFAFGIPMALVQETLDQRGRYGHEG